MSCGRLLESSLLCSPFPEHRCKGNGPYPLVVHVARPLALRYMVDGYRSMSSALHWSAYAACCVFSSVSLCVRRCGLCQVVPRRVATSNMVSPPGHAFARSLQGLTRNGLVVKVTVNMGLCWVSALVHACGTRAVRGCAGGCSQAVPTRGILVQEHIGTANKTCHILHKSLMSWLPIAPLSAFSHGSLLKKSR